jgi:hypothetical protein
MDWVWQGGKIGEKGGRDVGEGKIFVGKKREREK